MRRRGAVKITNECALGHTLITLIVAGGAPLPMCDMKSGVVPADAPRGGQKGSDSNRLGVPGLVLAVASLLRRRALFLVSSLLL